MKEKSEKILFDTIKKIKPLDKIRMKKKENELNSLLKTPKGLGKLEELAIKLEGMSENYKPKKKMVLVMAADNGVEHEKISKSKRVITQYVVEAMLNGKSSINALAAVYNADVKVVDLGIDKRSDTKKEINLTGTIEKKLMEFGTENIAKEAAMSYETAVKAINTGIELVNKFVKEGHNLFATGEMGIGNTTTSSAVLKVLTNLPLDDIVGYGSGIDDKTLEHKKNVIKKAIQVNGLLDFFEKSKNVEEKKNVKIVTNNIVVISKLLGNDNISVIGIGGVVRNKTMSFASSESLLLLKQYNIQKAFMAATAVNIKNGVMNSSFDERAVKMLAVEKAEQVYVLADSSKFDKSALLTYCDLDQLNLIITDGENKAYIDKLRKQGINVLQV